MSALPLHLWSFAAKKLEIGEGRSHGLCGVHIGRFVSDPDKVTCTDCLTIINSKESNGPQAAG